MSRPTRHSSSLAHSPCVSFSLNAALTLLPHVVPPAQPTSPSSLPARHHSHTPHTTLFPAHPPPAQLPILTSTDPLALPSAGCQLLLSRYLPCLFLTPHM